GRQIIRRSSAEESYSAAQGDRVPPLSEVEAKPRGPEQLAVGKHSGVDAERVEQIRISYGLVREEWYVQADSTDHGQSRPDRPLILEIHPDLTHSKIGDRSLAPKHPRRGSGEVLRPAECERVEAHELPHSPAGQCGRVTKVE